MNELALFAGVGGGILGGKLLGWRTVCAVERDAYAASVLAQRQNDGILESFPIWSDVCSFDGLPWRGIVDVVSGGFPCQDISVAGKGAGIDGERSGLWREMFRIVCEVRPTYVFVENSPALTSRGLGTVLGDLASVGFDAEWCVLGAHDIGAPHKRDRIWILAYSPIFRLEETRPKFKTTGASRACADDAYSRCFGWKSGRSKRVQPEIKEPIRENSHNICEDISYSDIVYVKGQLSGFFVSENRGNKGKGQARSLCLRNQWWSTEPRLGRVAHGVANRVDKLRAIGNGQVPAVARLAFTILKERLRLENE